MRILKNYLILGIVFGGLMVISLPSKVLAFCPLCVVSTGTITGVFRWLGVDDTIIGLWLGGFVLSVIILFNNFLIKRGRRISLQLPIIAVSFYLLMILVLFWAGLIVPYNTIFGINKIFAGMFFGSLALLCAPILDKALRRMNQGKIFISHQKVLITLSLLFLGSLILIFFN